jgi:hypothetical protein
MKFLFVLTLISLHSFAGTLCEVYGISDSPQALTCRFQREEIKLTCDDGTYLLGGVTVEAAYHLEVEEGPTPLVFHTKRGDLTVTLNSGRHHSAFFSMDGKKVRGNCLLK